jgi:hypothetical protein
LGRGVSPGPGVPGGGVAVAVVPSGVGLAGGSSVAVADGVGVSDGLLPPLSRGSRLRTTEPVKSAIPLAASTGVIPVAPDAAPPPMESTASPAASR